MVAYAFTKLQVPFRRVLFFLIVGSLLVPFQSIMYPLDTLLALGLIGDRIELAYAAFGLPFSRSCSPPTYAIPEAHRSVSMAPTRSLSCASSCP